MSEVCEKPSCANIPIGVGGSLTWQKLSPAEFQQLQDFMACKYRSNPKQHLLPSFLYTFNYTPLVVHQNNNRRMHEI